MRTKRKYFKTHMTRPRKRPGAKRRRQLEQKRRLVALGVDEAVADKLNPKEIRDKLKRPKKVEKELAAEAADKS